MYWNHGLLTHHAKITCSQQKRTWDVNQQMNSSAHLFHFVTIPRVKNRFAEWRTARCCPGNEAHINAENNEACYRTKIESALPISQAASESALWRLRPDWISVFVVNCQLIMIPLQGRWAQLCSPFLGACFRLARNLRNIEAKCHDKRMQ